MKKLLCLILIIFLGYNLKAQATSGKVPISITYSENGQAFIKSTSYDHEIATTRGFSEVYKNGEKLYTLNRSFDLYKNAKFRLVLSNDGSTIIYFTNQKNYEGDDFNNVTIYKHGKLVESYSTSEFTNCNYSNEDCGLIYTQSQIERIATLKSGIPDNEKEIFLKNNFLLVNNGFIYLVDQRKQVIKYDIEQLKVVELFDFDGMFDFLNDFSPPQSNIEYFDYYNGKYIALSDVKEIKSNKTIAKGIANLSKLKYIDYDDKYYKASNKIDLEGYLVRGGTFEVEKLVIDTTVFDRELILGYLQNTHFDVDGMIPKEVDRLFINSFFGRFRPKSITKSRDLIKERRALRLENYRRDILLDSINGIYIPKNIYEANVALDNFLSYHAKKQVLEKENQWMLNSHMGGLGMTIKYRWHINEGSRLSYYFNKRDIYDRDEISGILIMQYINWLNGDKESYKIWEEENPMIK